MGAQLTSRRRQGGLSLLFSFSLLLLLAASAILVYELVAFSRREALLPSGIIVAGVNVSGLSGRDAVSRWESAYAEPVVLLYPDALGGQPHPIRLHPDQIGWRISSEPMLADALASGETDGGFWRRFLDYLLGNELIVSREIALVADYQSYALEAFLQDLALRYDNPSGSPAYDLQTLTVYAGESGYALNIAAAMAVIDSSLRSAKSRTVGLPVKLIDSELPSLHTLRELIIDYLDDLGFIYDGQRTVASIFILDLISGEELNILGDVAYSAASTIKLPIMIDYFRARADRPSPDEAWLLANSLLCSNNASSNLLMEINGGGDIFAGIQSVTGALQRVGAVNSFITAPFYLGVEGQRLGSIQAPETAPNQTYVTGADPFNQTTAEDMATLFNLLYDCAEFDSGLATAFSEGQITRQECRQMLELTSANDLERLLQAGIPQGVRISHKNGWIFDTVGDAGIVYSPNGRHYVISVYLWEETEFQDYEKLWPLVEEISRAAWNFFNPGNALLVPRANLPATAQECEGNYLPPGPEYVNLDDINSWKRR
ncbi:MAG: serine hydrolase [Anaerolineaceae bacterium]|nr:serine hydrolase [Anaerolineaceae bacterium]